jgi:hypothetical protein
MGQSVRWTLAVSSDIDRRVRRFLAEAGRKGDLSRFVEEAVKTKLLELSMKSVPAHTRRSANDVEPAPQDSRDLIGERLRGG